MRNCVFMCVQDYANALRVTVRGQATLKLIANVPTIKMDSQTHMVRKEGDGDNDDGDGDGEDDGLPLSASSQWKSSQWKGWRFPTSSRCGSSSLRPWQELSSWE